MIHAQVTSLYFSGREVSLINCWSDTPSEHSSPKGQPPVKMSPRSSLSDYRKGRQLPTAHLITAHTVSVSTCHGEIIPHLGASQSPASCTTPTPFPQTWQQWMESAFWRCSHRLPAALKAVQAERFKATRQGEPGHHMSTWVLALPLIRAEGTSTPLTSQQLMVSVTDAGVFVIDAPFLVSQGQVETVSSVSHSKHCYM